MSVVLCLPAHLCVSPAASRGRPPTGTRHWGPQEQQAFDELKDKVANAKCLGVPRAQGEIILVIDASNVGAGGTLFQWQALEKEEFDSAIS